MFHGGKEVFITSTLKLDHCWVCSSTDALQEHHVVPTAYGGGDGPTVTLCPTHHDLLHETSFRDPSSWTFPGHPEVQAARLFYLTKVVSNSRRTVKTLNPERDLKVTVKFSPQEAKQFLAVRSNLGTTSHESTIRALVLKAYKELNVLNHQTPQ